MKKILALSIITVLSICQLVFADEVAQKAWYRAIIKCEEYKDYQSALNDINTNLAYADKNGFSYSMRALELRVLGKQKNYARLEDRAKALQNFMANNSTLGAYYQRTAPYYEACAAFGQGKYAQAIDKFKESTSGLSNSMFFTAAEGIARSYWNMGQKQSAISKLNSLPMYEREAIADLNTYPGGIVWKTSDDKFLEYALEEPLSEGLLRYNSYEIYDYKQYLSTH